ncbi:MAG: hypothetical protein WD535_05985 [Thermaerobacterales bacterium]
MTASPDTGIRFGTDGWRGIIADDFTFANVGFVTQAYSAWLHQAHGRPARVAIGYDTRFQSDRFARRAAAVLLAGGHDVKLSAQAATTPAITWSIREHGLDGALMITASHNPGIYNGIKLKGSYAGPALPGMTSEIEAILKADLAAGRSPSLADADSAAIEFDPAGPYLKQLAKLVDLECIAHSGLTAAIDVMHGAAAGYLPSLFAKEDIPLTELRSAPHPLFGGVHPEPLARHLAPLLDLVGRGGITVGLATDGDGDRVAAVDPVLGFVDAQQIFALLLQHLVEIRGWQGMVVKTFAGTRMVERLAERYGLPYRETPVGYRHVSELALTEDVLIGGEESGGIGVKNHMPERDGLLCNLLLLEIVAKRGRSLAEQMAALTAEVGPHYYAREDLVLQGGLVSLDPLSARPPAVVAGIEVTAVDRLDGLKLKLGDDGWLLLRPSGTEPLLRIYAEMSSRAALQEVLAAGVELVTPLA